MLTIKILGSGCANCKRLEQIVRKQVEELTLQAEIIKVTDYPSIMRYDIMATPGLVINEQLIASGRIPGIDEVRNWLTSAAA